MRKQGISLGVIAIALIVLVVLVVLAYNGLGAQKISDIKNPDNVGKNVRVRGEVETTIKIGQLSGYTLSDESGSIAVSAEKLPREGDTINVRGVLIRDSIFGYYIKADE